MLGAESADLIITGQSRLVALRHDGRAVIAITTTMDVYFVPDWRAIPSALSELVEIPGRLEVDAKGDLCQEREYFPFFVPELRIANYSVGPVFNVNEELKKRNRESVQRKIKAFLKDD